MSDHQRPTSPVAHPPGPLTLGGKTLNFGRQTYAMGIVNTTPDSFSDGGQFLDPRRAIDHGLALHDAGADILDIGGESTRPGAEPVDLDEEMSRVLPVIEALSQQSDAILSVDTTKSEVAAAALEAGAHLVNDISALGFDARMAQVVAHHDAALVLMHIQGRPRTMQQDIHYDDLLADITGFLRQRVQRAVDAGVDPAQIVLDPGIGFGKEVHHNYALIRRLPVLAELGYPLLVGPSRKSFLAARVDRPVDQRLMATASAVACAVVQGAHILRVHDVADMVDVLRIAEAVRGLPGPGSDP